MPVESFSVISLLNVGAYELYGTLFSSLLEIHATELGIVCGLFSVLCLACGRPTVSVAFLAIVLVGALGFLPYEPAGFGASHAIRKPWYFSAPAIALPLGYLILDERHDITRGVKEALYTYFG